MTLFYAASLQQAISPGKAEKMRKKTPKTCKINSTEYKK